MVTGQCIICPQSYEVLSLCHDIPSAPQPCEAAREITGPSVGRQCHSMQTSVNTHHVFPMWPRAGITKPFPQKVKLRFREEQWIAQGHQDVANLGLKSRPPDFTFRSCHISPCCRPHTRWHEPGVHHLSSAEQLRSQGLMSNCLSSNPALPLPELCHSLSLTVPQFS